MASAKVRTTVAIPRELLKAVDVAVQEGLARSRNELLAVALERQLAVWHRRAIDAAFADMADDPIYQKEALEIAEEFSVADWEAFEFAEGESP